MVTIEEIEKILTEAEVVLENDAEFVRLREFYKEMLERGVISKHQYDLPPVDTVGRNMYEIQNRANRKLALA